MTVSTLVSSVSYVGNGVSTIFTYPFYVIDAAHLQVWVNGALLPVNAYTVTSVGNQFGGEVRLNVAPAVGQQIDIKRSVPPTQLVDYRPYDPFPAETHEQALDKLTMIVQGNTGGIANAVRAPYLEPVGSTNLVLPGAATRANQVLGFDLSGNVMLYPFVGVPPYGISDHGQLSGLADDDHPQYTLRTDLANTYLPLTGGTMTGAIQLPPGFPALSTEAVSKAYVDTFTGSVLTKNIVSDATGDAQGTVQTAWNAQANALAVTRASNEIIYYRWKSTDTAVFRYVGSQQGPIAWATTAADWVSAAGVTEAPQDGFIYGRTSATWAQVVARSGGGYLGKVQGFAGAAAPADLARTDEAQALANAAVDAHEALLDPHPQYPLKADIVGTVVQDPQPAGMKQGQQWYESDTGGYYMRYVNPDATETLVSLAGAGGDFMPASGATGRFADGTAAAPGISWTNDTDTGWWRGADNSIHLAINGATVEDVLDYSGGTLYRTLYPAVPGPIQFTLSSNIATSSAQRQLALRVESGSYLFQESAFGGETSKRMRFSFASGIDVEAGVMRFTNGSASIPSISFSSDAQTGLFRDSAGVLAVAASGAYVISMKKNATYNTGQVQINGGYDGAFTSFTNAPLIIYTLTNSVPAVVLYQQGIAAWTIKAPNDGRLWIGSNSASGPGPLGGSAILTDSAGNVGGRTFTQYASTAFNVQPMTGALADVLKLRGVRCIDTETQRPDIRVVVDEVERVFPELVTELTAGQPKGINYAALAAPLIEAIRELTARVAVLEAKLGQ